VDSNRKQVEDLVEMGMTLEMAEERINLNLEHKERIENVAVAFYRAFLTPEGAVALDYLRGEYHDVPSYITGDPHETARNEGCRAVYLAIKYNIQRGESILNQGGIEHGK